MIQRLLKMMDVSTCNFMAIETLQIKLNEAGFSLLSSAANWDIKPGGKYYMIKNGTALFAFIAGNNAPSEYGFRIISSHSDSPCFKVKPNAEIYGEGGVISLNVEKYGGGILYTWFDRPLSLSGRVTLKGNNPLHPEQRLVDLKRPIATIPHLAIHFNRNVNEGNALSVQKDMKPVIGFFTPEEINEYKMKGGVIKSLLAEHLSVDTEQISDYELALYPVENASLCGMHDEYIQSGRLDDLSMVFASFEALLQAKPSASTQVMAVFDNEETGSGTKQGAASPVLHNLLHRICIQLESEYTEESFYRAIASSFMISADDAHAWHPNYNEKFDPTNHPVMGGGPAIKINANCKYMTDADGAAVFRMICDRAGVPCQYFVNHSDVAGGSTLGNILTSQLDLRGVDIGNPIWAMHSTRETGAVADHLYIIKAFSTFYNLP